MKLPLAKMTAQCWAAPVVYLWLLDTSVASGRRRVLSNREQIGSAVGIIREKTITKALQVLEACKLITYRVRAKKNKDGSYAGQFYEIVIGRRADLTLQVTHDLPSKRAKTTPPVDDSCWAEGQKRPLYPLKDSGAAPSAAAVVTSPAENNPLMKFLSGQKPVTA